MQVIVLNGLFSSGRDILTLECDFILQLENKKITTVFKLPSSIKFWVYWAWSFYWRLPIITCWTSDHIQKLNLILCWIWSYWLVEGSLIFRVSTWWTYPMVGLAFGSGCKHKRPRSKPIFPMKNPLYWSKSHFSGWIFAKIGQ